MPTVRDAAQQADAQRDVERRIEELSPGLKAFLHRHLRSEEDAEDALQEILLHLFRSMGDDLDSIVNLPAWLYKSARNLLANIGRKKTDLRTEQTDWLLALMTDDSSDPTTLMLRDMFWTELDKSLKRLPPEQRLVWEMTELDGCSVKDVAAITHTPVATLLSRKHYAVKRLSRDLNQLYKDIMNI